jgi:MerR family transcriptional regulator/heat shock protein HspR
MAKRNKNEERSAVYVISVAAELAGVHPQTLRVYERKGLLQPERTSGNTRRYSVEDIIRLRRIQELTQNEGVNLAGARKILRLEEQLVHLRRDLDRMAARIEELEADALAGEVRKIAKQAAELVPAWQHRSLQELWSELRMKEASGREPIELGPTTT